VEDGVIERDIEWESRTESVSDVVELTVIGSVLVSECDAVISVVDDQDDDWDRDSEDVGVICTVEELEEVKENVGEVNNV